MVGALPAWTLVLVAGVVSPAPPTPPNMPLPGTAVSPSPPLAPAPQPFAPPAADEDPPIVLSWSVPEDCPPIDDLRAEIRRVAGPVPIPAQKPEARAVVRRGPKDLWQLTLTTRSGALTGERRLAAPSCAELMRAAALVLALMINPTAAAAAPPPPPPPPATIVVELPPPPPAPLRFALGIDVEVGTGLVPGAAGGLGLRLGWGRGHLGAELRASAWTSKSTLSSADASTGGSFDLTDGDAALCARARPDRRVVPAACVGGSVFRLHGTGFGVSNPGQATAWWPGAFLEASVRFALTLRHALRVAADGLVPIGRPTFALDGVGSVWRPSAFAARGIVGWEVHF